MYGLAADPQCPAIPVNCPGIGSKPYCDGGRWMCTAWPLDTHHDAVTAAIWAGFGSLGGLLVDAVAANRHRPLRAGLVGGAAGLVALYAVALVSYGK